MAKAGQMDAVKIMAKDLVRTRRYVKKFVLMSQYSSCFTQDTNLKITSRNG